MGKKTLGEGSYLPDYSIMMDDNTDTSLWESMSPESIGKFNFVHGTLQVVDVMKSQATVSSKRREQKCLRSPTSITHIPRLNLLLVTEEQFNRIGIYDAIKLKWSAWLMHPNPKKSFNSPSSILALDDKVVLVERSGILILNIAKGSQLVFSKFFKGSFHGLARKSEDSMEFLTVYLWNDLYHLAIMDCRRIKNTIKLKLVEVKSAKIRFLTCNNEKVVVTDQGNHRMITVDLKTKKMRIDGYFGSTPKHFNQPTGVLIDDKNHILVSDSVNNRLLVYSHDLRPLKVVSIGESASWSVPQDILRIGQHVYVVFSGGARVKDGGEAAVVRYKLKMSGDDSPDTSKQ